MGKNWELYRKKMYIIWEFDDWMTHWNYHIVEISVKNQIQTTFTQQNSA